MVLDFIAQRPETLAQLMAVKIGAEPVRSVHTRWIQRLPAVFDRIERGVHNNAMRVKVRIELPTRFVPEAGRHEITCHALAVLPCFPYPRFRPLFELQHSLSDRPIVQFQDALILVKPDHRNALWRCNCEVEKDPSIGFYPFAVISDRVQPLAQT